LIDVLIVGHYSQHISIYIERKKAQGNHQSIRKRPTPKEKEYCAMSKSHQKSKEEEAFESQRRKSLKHLGNGKI
jgi:3'-phosphoadenosine 5'-phosphosulfate (PAPS) 3'-phosphatase